MCSMLPANLYLVELRHLSIDTGIRHSREIKLVSIISGRVADLDPGIRTDLEPGILVGSGSGCFWSDPSISVGRNP